MAEHRGKLPPAARGRPGPAGRRSTPQLVGRRFREVPVAHDGPSAGRHVPGERLEHRPVAAPGVRRGHASTTSAGPCQRVQSSATKVTRSASPRAAASRGRAPGRRPPRRRRCPERRWPRPPAAAARPSRSRGRAPWPAGRRGLRHECAGAGLAQRRVEGQPAMREPAAGGGVERHYAPGSCLKGRSSNVQRSGSTT